MLAAKIQERGAVLSVLGLGHVGLPLSAAFSRAGFRVLGYDTDAARVASLRRGNGVLAHLEAWQAHELARAGRFEATADHERLSEADVHLICVPTPLGPGREPDLRHVQAAAHSVARALRPGGLVVLCSTSYPGTTREQVGAILSSGGLLCGRDYALAHAPEREDPGRRDWPARSVPRIVGGVDARSGEMARALFAEAFDSVHLVSTAEVAESAKLLENVFRAVNIGLVNELKLVLEALSIDVWEVLDAAGTKPYGYMRFDPGPGLGGHCIPVDPWYLAWAARRAGKPARFVELAGEVNTHMPEHVLRKLVTALASRGQPLRGARVLLLGVAYKPELADVRESPALYLWKRLTELGARVGYSDPHVPSLTVADSVEPGRSLEMSPEALAAFDAAVLLTPHAAFDYELISAHAALLIDTRHVLHGRMHASGRYVAA